MATGELIAGRYRLLEQVGSGSMGAVWRALDTELDRVVALKRAHVVTTPEDEERVRREARAAAGVHHPGVVTLFDVVGYGAGRWLVMEFVPAKSLAEILAAQGPLPPAEVARIGAELAAALAAVHAAGIVHRDIKPGNVLVVRADAPAGAIKLTDFGIARGSWNEATLTASALVIGTPAYLAPEVAGGAAPTANSDVFGLGATLYAAVEGAAPYGAAENPLALLRRAVAGQVTPMQAAGRLAPVLEALLALDPAARPSAADAQAMLAGVRDGVAPTLALATTVPAGTLPATPPAPRRAPRRPVVVLGAVLALAAAGGVAVLATSGSDSPALAPTSTGADSPALAPASTGSGSRLGDRRSADPCAVLDRTRLGAAGTAEPRPGGPFEGCAARLTLPTGARVDVAVQLQERGAPVPGPPDVVVRQFTVSRPGSAAGTCARTVLLPAGEAVAIRAAAVSGADADPCPVADAAVEAAVTVLARGPLPRRGPAFATGSLGRTRACALLPAKSLARVSALDGADPQTGFADWSCRWVAGSSAAELRFARAATETGAHLTLSGHRAYVRPGAGTCLVRVVNLKEAGTAGTAEFADVVRRGGGSARALCAQAEVLAGEVAERLPTTTATKKPTRPAKARSGAGESAPAPAPAPAPDADESAGPPSPEPTEGQAARAARCGQLALEDPIKAADECGDGGAG